MLSKASQSDVSWHRSAATQPTCSCLSSSQSLAKVPSNTVLAALKTPKPSLKQCCPWPKHKPLPNPQEPHPSRKTLPGQQKLQLAPKSLELFNVTPSISALTIAGAGRISSMLCVCCPIIPANGKPSQVYQIGVKGDTIQLYNPICKATASLQLWSVLWIHQWDVSISHTKIHTKIIIQKQILSHIYPWDWYGLAHSDFFFSESFSHR